MCNIRRDGNKLQQTAGHRPVEIVTERSSACNGGGRQKLNMLRLQGQREGARVHQLRWIDFVPARARESSSPGLISKTLTDRLSRFRGHRARVSFGQAVLRFHPTNVRRARPPSSIKVNAGASAGSLRRCEWMSSPGRAVASAWWCADGRGGCRPRCPHRHHQEPFKRSVREPFSDPGAPPERTYGSSSCGAARPSSALA